MDGSQLAVENAGKAVLGLAGRIGRTHNPAAQLRRLISEGQRDRELPELLGPDIHIQTDYGDEAEGRTPWELFDEDDAHQALDIAREAVDLAGQVIEEVSS